jgi:hypothetical protein
VKQLESELADLDSQAAAKRNELSAAKERQASI